MAFKKIESLEPEVKSALGGRKKDGTENPKTITGYYYGSVLKPSDKSKTGFQHLHYFKTETKLVGIYGSTDLDEKLASVTCGNKVRATFQEMKKTKTGNDFKVYLVEEDSDDSMVPPELPKQRGEQPAPPKGGRANPHSDFGNEDVPF